MGDFSSDSLDNEKMECSRGSSSADANSQPGKFPPVRGCSVNGSTRASVTFRMERWLSTSNLRIDSISSPKNSMRSGRALLRRKNIQDAAADGIFAGHLHRIALLVPDGAQVLLDGFERQLFAGSQFERETPVVFGGVGSQQSRCDRGNGDGRLRDSIIATNRWRAAPVISLCGERFCPGSTSSAGSN